MPVNNIAKWDGLRWSPLGNGIGSGRSIPYVQALTVFDDGSGPALIAGGSLSSPAMYITQWDGSTWSDVGKPLDDWILVLQSFDDGTGQGLYAGGGFLNAGNLTVNHVARWDGAGWSNLGQGVGPVDATVYGVTTYDDGTGLGLFFGGNFETAGNFAVSGVAKWGCVRGDLNCDGAFNGADIDPFFLALCDPPAYAAQFPNCDPLLGDLNGDGRLDGGDIDPFFQCLGGNCP